MLDVFLASASNGAHHNQVIARACQDASTVQRRVTPWFSRDEGAEPIDQSVESWIDGCDAFVADITKINDNVTYEIGYAIGSGKSVRLIRSTSGDFKPIQSLGLLSPIAHSSYYSSDDLSGILSLADVTPKWQPSKKSDSPVFILLPYSPTEYSQRVTSSVKKIAKVKYRSFSPAEINRLSAMEAYEHVSSSHGVIVFWFPGDGQPAIKNNQRAAFIHGVARGLEIPTLLIAHDNQRLPMDLEEQATRWSKLDQLDNIIRSFRDAVADHSAAYVSMRDRQTSIINKVSCGDPVAENEAGELSGHFLETPGYQLAVSGQANVLHGRKGSGKTAVFLQVRNKSRKNKKNIVIDLMPDGYQLVKMKEVILSLLSRGTRKQVIAAFWEYVLWLEIAHKILEKDQMVAARGNDISEQYDRLSNLFSSRVDTGAGDFSERVKILVDNIVNRFSSSSHDKDDISQLPSSKVLELVYGHDIKEMRDEVLQYLKVKGFVLFLFDNLDRFWTPGGFTEDDALIVIGLMESMQEIQRKFRRHSLELRWSIFVRGDVYEFLIRGMADFGKISAYSLEWSDRDLMKALVVRRLESSLGLEGVQWDKAWNSVSEKVVRGMPVLDFLVDGSMMRPRHIIRLFETARLRAVSLGHTCITEADYIYGLKEVGLQILEDLDREISDLVPNAEEFLFSVISSGSDLTVSSLTYMAGTLAPGADVKALLNVMIWSGCLGVENGPGYKFIYEAGYKRQIIDALLKAKKDPKLALHPTLVSAYND